MEAKVQKRLITYLKKRGCYVLKTKPQPGIPVGCLDVIFFYEGFWGAVECKASMKSPYQPLQLETLKKFNEWSWARAIYPENYDEIIAELDMIL